MKKILALILCAAMFTALLSGCGEKQAQSQPQGSTPVAGDNQGNTGSGGPTKDNPDVWKTGTSAGLVNGHHVIYDFMLQIKDEIESATDGRYQLETYHSSQLGSDRDMLEGTVMGTYKFALVPSTFISAYVDDFNVYEFPFLFESTDHFFDVMESDMAKEMGKKLEDSGLVWLGNGMNGILTISNSQRDLRTLDDFKGLKLRCIDSNIQVEAVNLLGATGTVVNWGETYTALQQHTIDGVITTGSGFLSGKIYEVNKFHTAANMFYTPITAVVNKEYWDSLPAEDQQLIQDAVNRALQWDRENSEAMLDKDMQECIDLGPMSEVPYEEFDSEAARAAMQPLYDKYQDAYGTYFDAIRAMA